MELPEKPSSPTPLRRSLLSEVSEDIRVAYLLLTEIHGQLKKQSVTRQEFENLSFVLSNIEELIHVAHESLFKAKEVHQKSVKYRRLMTELNEKLIPFYKQALKQRSRLSIQLEANDGFSPSESMELREQIRLRELEIQQVEAELKQLDQAVGTNNKKQLDDPIDLSKGVQQIAEDLEETVGLMNDTFNLLVLQREGLDLIEDNVEHARENTEKGTETLLQALEIASNRRFERGLGYFAATVIGIGGAVAGAGLGIAGATVGGASGAAGGWYLGGVLGKPIDDRLARTRDGDHFDEGFWQKDEDVAQCTECRGVFSFFYRRHHCRFCGYIFCRRCLSSQQVYCAKLNRPAPCCVDCAAREKGEPS